MTLPASALTSRANVKQYLSITDASQDALLENLIRRASFWFEARTGRRFLKQTYTNELHDGGRDTIFLDNFPVIPGSLTSLQFRTGTLANPIFQDFQTNDFILIPEGGYIEILQGFRVTLSGRAITDAKFRGVQNIRATYDAGFLIDFNFPDDTAKHTLPLDIEDFVIRLVGRRFNKRKAEGVASESVEGASITWTNPTSDMLSDDDKAILKKYERKQVASTI